MSAGGSPPFFDSWRQGRARVARNLVLALSLAIAGVASAVAARDVTSVRAAYDAMDGRLATSPFGRPLVLESSLTDDVLAGDVYAVVEHPFARVHDALRSRAHWCDILLLHINVKGCSAADENGRAKLALAIGRKRAQVGAETNELALDFRVATSSPAALRIVLTAAEGPLGTRDYHIELAAIPLDERRTFVHLRYAYAYALPARLAVQTYLATFGRDKVGFSTVASTNGRAEQRRGLRGMIERTAMRIYLAVDAYLATYALPPTERAEQRLRTWFASTERYARQLREMDEAEYLAIKRADLSRQREAGR